MINSIAIDFGHTNYKIAIIKNNKIISLEIKNYQEDSLFDILNEITGKFDYEKILCANVLKESYLKSLLLDISNEIKSKMKFYSPIDCEKYIKLSYAIKTRFGVDRALNLVGASLKSDNDIIVIDAGTATTVDYLDIDKNHCGGIILPGKKIIDSFFYEAFDFDFYDEGYSDNVFSKNSRSCIENGSHISAYNSLNIVIEKMLSVKKTKPDIYVTGGNAQNVIDNCNYSAIHVKLLLFDGLIALEG